MFFLITFTVFSVKFEIPMEDGNWNSFQKVFLIQALTEKVYGENQTFLNQNSANFSTRYPVGPRLETLIQ